MRLISEPSTELEPHQIFIKLIVFIVINILFYFSFTYIVYLLSFSLDICSQNMVFYLQTSPVLNLNAYFHLFLCCSFLDFDLLFALKEHI